MLLADPDNDAVLVMNVETAIARASDIATTVTRVIDMDRKKRSEPKPVLAVWVGAEDSVSKALSDAVIPSFPTEDDAVRGFMHLVNHREVVEALAEVPPSLPNAFVPDVDTARHIVETAVAAGRRWLDPIEVRRLFEIGRAHV